jgi:prefoldin beta subunit
MEKDAEEKIGQLQLIEYNMHQLSSQRQQFHNQLLELESALNELNNKEKAYKIVGNIMVEMPAKDLQTDLTEKKERVELRIKHLEKQEKQLKEKAEQLQGEVMQAMKE